MKEKSFLKPIGNKSIVDKVVQRITDAIIAGELRPGDKIPTEIELSENFGVARNSIREAIKILSALGVLEIRRPNGTYISNKFSGKMLDPIVYYLILEQDSSTAIVELRRLFEVGILELAIEKATQDDIRNLEDIHLKLVKEVSKDKKDYQKITERDIEFHKHIISITRNPLMAKIGDIIIRLTTPSQVKTVKKIMESTNPEFIIETHEEILLLIKNKSYSNIRNVIEKSYSVWRHNVN
ncbi:MAG: GntR family transcriptional regulator, transcriptional repressor for pyruvate dehydrogenase complex [Clostridiales bacterium]|jgi:DNA-binding FadR family transcriptional regulator|nr:GntR family transcriptional regulator, transcriptional repressor for pyruvate dehydrogenase complex [Clostridiales bacterium]MDK2933243.1 GntR family transcriptional regulator, transcriptional repressor for pyruvate dehydrogenase complex [Clostridiales bacterium]